MIVTGILVAVIALVSLFLGYVAHARVPQLTHPWDAGHRPNFFQRLVMGNAERTLAETGANIVEMLQAGIEEQAREITRLKEQIATLTSENAHLRQELSDLRENIFHSAKIEQLTDALTTHTTHSDVAHHEIQEALSRLLPEN